MSLLDLRLEAQCPAKVNLALSVLGVRADGYHEIRTVFQAVDLADTLVVRPSRDLTLSCEAVGVPRDASNLVVRAARLLAERCGVRAGAAIALTKRIPVGGGMGGGSSDAAGALVALSALWGLGLGVEDLEPLAARVGADVPFFLHGGTAVGDERGDRIAPMPFAGPLRLLLAVPPFGIPAAEAYAWADAHLTLAPKDVSVEPAAAGKVSPGKDFRWGVNDLEAGVFERFPGLLAMRDGLLRGGASIALLSGSGSTVFGVFDDSGSLQRAAENLATRFPGWRLLPARGVPDAARVVAAGGPV
ncbi:MAG: 4-(cytidine 5'-diphospho)-2-C-methyl-D-erythritol kinase [Acidobacteriia bacterium]|nr:4-(cytidine 5'-diphospho)-2-C-methyl-D-erythritol kinase [Terriglobia bacterium]